MKKKRWYESWFNSPYYHILYQHRDVDEANTFISNLIDLLKPNKHSHILDLACGTGRHAVMMANMGFEVAGIDLSTNNIKKAKKKEKPNLHFYVHDMREEFRHEYFDYVFNFFTSFGYFDVENDNQRAIAAMKSNLKSKGVLVIDFMNTEFVLKNLIAEEIIELDGIRFCVKKMLKDNFIIKTIDVSDEGMKLQFQERVQVLKLSDFRRYFELSNISLDRVFGDYSLNEFNAKSSERLILIGHRK